MSACRVEPQIVIENEKDDSFKHFVEMEELFEKLKLLNYYSEFAVSLKIKPINRYYFTMPKNTGEQFFLFSSLAAWLIRKAGKHFEEPYEYDDPNNVIANILQAIREFGDTVDFPPNKLKQGIGEHVIYVLNKLCDNVIKKEHVKWAKSEIFEEKEIEEEQEAIDDESEIILDQIEEEMLAIYSDDSDDDNALKVNDIINLDTSQIPQIDTNIDLESWKLELERVLPQLKFTIKSSSHDWRTRLNHMKDNHSHLKKMLVSSKMQLNRVQKDISFSLEKIQNRERYLNKELHGTLKEYIEVLNQLLKIKEDYNGIASGMNEKTRLLSQLSDSLETYKHQMEARGNSMTDGTPLVNIKKSISKVKSEIIGMDIRIGVLECFLLQAKLKERKILEEGLNYTVTFY